MVLGGFRSFHVLVTTHTLSVLKGHDDRVEQRRFWNNYFSV